MGDLISRADAVEILRARAEMEIGKPKVAFFAAADMLEKLPAVDAVQVVRCRDCAAILKAHGARVVAFDEIDNYEVLWLEVRNVKTEDGLAPWVKTESGRWFSPLICGKERPDMILATAREYGRISRCWTSRPTDAQREAIPWE